MHVARKELQRWPQQNHNNELITSTEPSLLHRLLLSERYNGLPPGGIERKIEANIRYLDKVMGYTE